MLILQGVGVVTCLPRSLTGVGAGNLVDCQYSRALWENVPQSGEAWARTHPEQCYHPLHLPACDFSPVSSLEMAREAQPRM